jgi:hypothetical protein
MVAKKQVAETQPPFPDEDPAAAIIRKVLPLFAAACKEGVAVRPQCRLLIAEVDRLCTEYGLQDYGMLSSLTA